MLAAPLRKNPLIRKRLVPVVHAVEHGCYRNACNVDIRESPGLDENMDGDSAAFSGIPANGVSAMADSVLHGESSKRLATPRNTKDKITFNQPNRPNRQTPQTKHKALPDSVSPVAEEAEIQTLTGGVAEARRESHRVAAARRKAARVRDAARLNQAMACIHQERWPEAMLDELHS